MSTTLTTAYLQRGDKVDSRFFHLIHYRTNKPPTKGYSKWEGHQEKKDGIIQLQNVIVRLKCSNYTQEGGTNSLGRAIDPVDYIEFFLNEAEGPIKILELYDTDFETYFDEFPHPRFWQWLRFFCEDIKAGTAPAQLRSKHLNFCFTRVFDARKPRFLDRKSLVTYCRRLTRDGHDGQVIEEFHQEYIDRWFSESNTIDLDWLSEQQRKRTMGELSDQTECRPDDFDRYKGGRRSQRGKAKGQQPNPEH